MFPKVTTVARDLGMLAASSVAVHPLTRRFEETRMFLLVVCAGALGSLVHGLRLSTGTSGIETSFGAGVPKYLIQPFGASVLAVVFYLVIRGGFFSLTPVHNTLPLRIHSAQRDGRHVFRTGSVETKGDCRDAAKQTACWKGRGAAVAGQLGPTDEITIIMPCNACWRTQVQNVVAQLRKFDCWGRGWNTRLGQSLSRNRFTGV